MKLQNGDKLNLTIEGVLITTRDWKAISDALFRAANQDGYMSNAIKGDPPFVGESSASNTVGKALKMRGDRTREYATLLMNLGKE